jgi:hypothetical protein
LSHSIGTREREREKRRLQSGKQSKPTDVRERKDSPLGFFLPSSSQVALVGL